MRALAFTAVLGLSILSVSAAGGSSVPFSVFAITNTQSIPMKVTVEAPVGKVIYGPVEVNPDGAVSIDPKVENIASAKVIVDYGKDHGTAEQTVTLGGEKNKVYIKTLMAAGAIGSVKVTDVAGSNP